MRLLAIVGLLGISVIGMRMGVVVMVIRAIVHVAVITPRTVVMPERHALAGRNSRQTLNRNGQSQQQDGKKAQESSRHRRQL
jgi:hypothetical protein